LAPFKTIFFLLVLGSIVYVGLKVVLVYYGNYQLQDAMQTEARFALANRHTVEDIRNVVYREVRNQELPLRAEDILITFKPEGVFISANYSVPVDLRVYKFDLHFNPTSGP